MLVGKLTGDLSKILDESARIQRDLHAAQDYIAGLQPVADIVLGIRARQEAWDRAKRAIETEEAHGVAAALASPFHKAQELRKLGPRPTLTL